MDERIIKGKRYTHEVLTLSMNMIINAIQHDETGSVTQHLNKVIMSAIKKDNVELNKNCRLFMCVLSDELEKVTQDELKKMADVNHGR